MALLIHPDGSMTEIIGENPSGDIPLDQIKRLLGGPAVVIQYVPCNKKKSGGYDHFFMDDEAKFKRLPLNEEATLRATLGIDWDFISGPALFCNSKNTRGARSY